MGRGGGIKDFLSGLALNLNVESHPIWKEAMADSCGVWHSGEERRAPFRNVGFVGELGEALPL